MVNIELNGKEYKMATSWEDVTLKKYQVLVELFLEEEINQLEKTIRTFSILSDISYEDLMEVDMDDFNKINLNFLLEEIPQKVENIIEIEGKKYGVVKDIKKISLGEYVDLDNYSKSSSNFHFILGILMRPVVDSDGELYTIEKYDSNNLEERSILFKENINVSQYYSLVGFFFNFGNSFLENLSHYLNQKNI